MATVRIVVENPTLEDLVMCQHCRWQGRFGQSKENDYDSIHCPRCLAKIASRSPCGTITLKGILLSLYGWDLPMAPIRAKLLDAKINERMENIFPPKTFNNPALALLKIINQDEEIMKEPFTELEMGQWVKDHPTKARELGFLS